MGNPKFEILNPILSHPGSFRFSVFAFRISHLAGGQMGGAPLIPKLRGYFAEFLREVSLARLGLLDPPTCVGLRYGQPGEQQAALPHLCFELRDSCFEFPPFCVSAKRRGHPFFRSYGARLPSSLTRFHSRAWVYSTHPPVSVYGTGDLGNKREVFLVFALKNPSWPWP